MSVTGSGQGWSSSGTGGTSVLPGVSAQRLRVAFRCFVQGVELAEAEQFQGRLAGAVVGKLVEPADLVEEGGVVELAEIAAGFGQELLEGVESVAPENVVRIAAGRRRCHPQQQALAEVAHDAAVIGLRGRRLGDRIVAVMRNRDGLDRARQRTTPVGADRADGDDAVRACEGDRERVLKALRHHHLRPSAEVEAKQRTTFGAPVRRSPARLAGGFMRRFLAGRRDEGEVQPQHASGLVGVGKHERAFRAAVVGEPAHPLDDVGTELRRINPAADQVGGRGRACDRQARRVGALDVGAALKGVGAVLSRAVIFVGAAARAALRMLGEPALRPGDRLLGRAGSVMRDEGGGAEAALLGLEVKPSAVLRDLRGAADSPAVPVWGDGLAPNGAADVRQLRVEQGDLRRGEVGVAHSAPRRWWTTVAIEPAAMLRMIGSTSACRRVSSASSRCVRAVTALARSSPARSAAYLSTPTLGRLALLRVS